MLHVAFCIHGVLMPHPTSLSVTDTGLLVIDVQEKLVPLIHQSKPLLRNIEFLVDAANLLKLPVQATEQYPKGLGGTVPALAAKLPAERPDKVDFSCCAARGVVEKFHQEARPKILLAG